MVLSINLVRIFNYNIMALNKTPLSYPNINNYFDKYPLFQKLITEFFQFKNKSFYYRIYTYYMNRNPSKKLLKNIIFIYFYKKFLLKF